MIKNRKLLWLGFISSLILATLLFASCSTNAPSDVSPIDAPSEETDSQAVDAGEETEVVDDISEIFSDAPKSGESSQETSNAVPAASEFDGDVPVGFTESGNPYRGNPNAPVVFEEFSDFQ